MHNLQQIADPQGWFARVAEFSLDRGWIGVQLFFVLSGFLITGILMDTQRAPNYYRSFFARRSLRIFPLYFAVLAILFLGLPALGLAPNATLHDQWPYWLYASNWTQPASAHPPFVSAYWSLAVEEQFYLVWPVLLHRLSPGATWRLAVAIATIALLVRCAMLANGADPEAVYCFTICRMDALALGSAAAAALRIERFSVQKHWNAKPLLAAAAGVFACGFLGTRGYPRTSAWGQTLGYSTLAVSFALLVLAAACADRDRVDGAFRLLRSWHLRTLGFYSYAIYLFHQPLHRLAGRPLLVWLGTQGASHVLPSLAYICTILLASVGLARLSFVLIESPFLRLKPRFLALAA